MQSKLIWEAGLFVAIVVVAGLVNRFQPSHRAQVRRVVILWSFHVATFALHYGLDTAGETVWSSRLLVVSELFQVFTLVNVVATAVFGVLLPAVG